MKSFIVIIAFAHLTLLTTAQTGNYIKKPTLGINLALFDFPKKASLNEMKQGLGITYLKGLNNHFDFIASLTGSFISYPIPDKPLSDKQSTLMEVNTSIHAKLFSDRHWVTPFISAGAGTSVYKNYYGLFLPGGVGLQVNFWDDVFLLVNTQYRLKLTHNIPDHLFYSIGLAGNIGRKKNKKQHSSHSAAVPSKNITADKDTDGDGINDSMDACPLQPGLAMFAGCPDSDGDGIADKDDKCPNTPGLARLQGCPVPDSDKDGVNDEDDRCPLVPGLPAYKGCPPPDSDNDGVSDETDKCPDLPGTLQNQGCPVINADITNRIDSVSKFIFFETGSYKLLSKSTPALKLIAEVLNTMPLLKLDISGHTDNTGTTDKNLALSKNRAESIKNYLISNGIEENRLFTIGYGQFMPIDTNETPEGRARNRRVEMKLKYY